MKHTTLLFTVTASLVLTTGCDTTTTKTTVLPDDQSVAASAAYSTTSVYDIAFSKPSFNPSQGDSVLLALKCREAGLLVVSLADEDGFVVKHDLLRTQAVADSTYTIMWDGTDDSGVNVPDEAYYPLVELATENDTKVFHPALFTGGATLDVKEDKYDPMTGTITYTLPAPSRVNIRAGIAGGALLNTVVDWEPRIQGKITESWAGTDNTNTILLSEVSERSSLLVRAYELPRPHIIAYGSAGQPYRQYRFERDTVLAKRFPVDKLRHGDKEQSRHFFEPRCFDYAPTIHVTFPHEKAAKEDSLLTLSGKTLMRVEIDKEDIQFIDEQYEITIFLDFDFYAEEELGYTPFNWLWDLGDVEEGIHYLTINVASYRDRIGVSTQKIRIVK